MNKVAVRGGYCRTRGSLRGLLALSGECQRRCCALSVWGRRIGRTMVQKLKRNDMGDGTRTYRHISQAG